MARQRSPRPEPNIPKQRPHGVICYWEFKPSPTQYRDDCEWVLKESFAIDADGHCLTTPSTGGGDRQEWHKWMNERIYNYQNRWYTLPELEKELGPFLNDKLPALFDDWREIMGRAVTLWTLESGVQLLDFHPLEWAKWMAVGAYDKLCKLTEWTSIIERGHDLYFGTANTARQYLFREYTNDRS